SPLESLLIERIGLCWLAVHHAELDAASALKKDQGASSLSLYAQKRLDSCHRRYLLAIRQLATVRKLLRPQRSCADLAKGVRTKRCRDRFKALARMSLVPNGM